MEVTIINLGERGRDEYADEVARWNGCWFHGFDLIALTNVGAGVEVT